MYTASGVIWGLACTIMQAEREKNRGYALCFLEALAPLDVLSYIGDLACILIGGKKTSGFAPCSLEISGETYPEPFLPKIVFTS